MKKKNQNVNSVNFLPEGIFNQLFSEGLFKSNVRGKAISRQFYLISMYFLTENLFENLETAEYWQFWNHAPNDRRKKIVRKFSKNSKKTEKRKDTRKTVFRRF